MINFDTDKIFQNVSPLISHIKLPDKHVLIPRRVLQVLTMEQGLQPRDVAQGRSSCTLTMLTPPDLSILR